jgi:hypothetical protein
VPLATPVSILTSGYFGRHPRGVGIIENGEPNPEQLTETELRRSDVANSLRAVAARAIAVACQRF